MAHIDFAVAFIVVFMMISYSVFFVSNTLSKDFSQFDVNELEKSQESLADQLFYSTDSNSLVYNLKKAQVVFEEVGSYDHTENILLSITPIVNNLHVYTLTMNEIPSVYSDGNLSFSLGFLQNQKNYIELIYDGSIQDIGYNNTQNITANINFERTISVLSIDKCNNLQALSYNESKNAFGMEHNFRIDDNCIYGQIPPEDANIIVKKIPMIIEDSDKKLYSASVTLKVW